jgi:hypothetical protein
MTEEFRSNQERRCDQNWRAQRATDAQVQAEVRALVVRISALEARVAELEAQAAEQRKLINILRSRG